MFILERIAKPAILTALLLVATCCTPAIGAGVLHQSTGAGKFYPADSTELRLAVTRYLDEALPARADQPLAIIVPHASYIYSGQIAADAFKQTAGMHPDLIVVLGTNHTTADFHGISVYPQGRFATPIGQSIVDNQAAQDLLRIDPDCSVDLSVHEKEHSIDVELPFVQVLFPAVKILPVVVANQDLQTCSRLGKALAAIAKNHRILVVASSDLSHYPTHSDARRVDRDVLRAICSLDPAAAKSVIESQLSSGVPDLVTCACGEGPILVAMAAAKELGAKSGSVISYINSGDCSLGQLKSVVGYGAVSLTAGEHSDTGALHWPEAQTNTTLTAKDKLALLTLARKSIEWYATAATIPLPRGFDPPATVREGAFVTLKVNGDLRGCIGHLEQDLPLCQVVGNMAVAAAFEDRRFKPVTVDELSKITIEISVLTPMRPIADIDSIRLGIDGIFLQKDGKSAIFLPQIPIEQKWSRDETLTHLCHKAGLPTDAWKSGTEFSTFQTEVFSEDHHE